MSGPWACFGSVIGYRLNGDGRRALTLVSRGDGASGSDPPSRDESARLRARFAALLRSGSDMFLVLDAEGRVQEVRGPSLLPRPAVGVPLRESWATPPAHVAARLVEHARKECRALSDECELSLDSECRHVEVRCVPTDLGELVVVLRDVTEHHLTRQDLIEGAVRYRELVETSIDLIWSLDGASRWTFLNRRATRRILGYEPEELLHRPIHALQVEGEEPWTLDTFARTAAPETRLRRRDGEVAILRFNGIVRHDRDGRVIAATGTATDVTEQRRVEEERRQLDLKVQEAQKLESLGVLAGGIAHDFNNLLAGILGAAEVMQRQLGSEPRFREHLEIIQQCGWRASELSRQMLAYAGKGRFDMQHTDISELVFGTVHLLDSSISRKVRLELRLSHDIPAVYADITQLRQVVMNLVTNASEALGDRAGVITVQTRVVDYPESIDFTDLEGNLARGRYVFLEVSDTGSGMDEDTRMRIFEPFFTTKFTGRGLGLAAVLGIVKGHSGAIHVESVPGRGTTVRVLLPASETPAQSLAEHEQEAVVRFGGGSVLVIDDEPAVRAVVMHVLEGVGFDVLTCSGGRAAVDMLRANRHEVVLAVLDMTMPDLSGEETLSALRSLEPVLPVILTSGYDEHDTLRSLAAEPPTGFLQKPYRTSSLLAAVRTALAGRKRAEAKLRAVHGR